jgi:hypothetical protein
MMPVDALAVSLFALINEKARGQCSGGTIHGCEVRVAGISIGFLQNSEDIDRVAMTTTLMARGVFEQDNSYMALQLDAVLLSPMQRSHTCASIALRRVVLFLDGGD